MPGPDSIVTHAELDLNLKSKIYIGNMYAYQNLKKNSNLVSICCYDCDLSDPMVIPIRNFLDTTNNKHQNDNDAREKIFQGVQEMQQHYERGNDILVHCHMGMNRSGAIIAAWLILFMNYDPVEAVKLLEKANYTRKLPVLTNKVFKKIVLSLERPVNHQEVPPIQLLTKTVIPISISIIPDIWSAVPQASFFQNRHDSQF